MKSGKWHGRYDDDHDMTFPTYSKQKKNTPNTTLKMRNKKKKDDVAKNPRYIETKSRPPNTSVSKADTSKRSIIVSEISKKTMKLELFPVEILAHIFEQLWDSNKEAFTNLCCTSKALYLNSEYFLFRTLFLSDATDQKRSVSISALQRLASDSECNLWKCIRHIKIGPIIDADWFYDVVHPALPRVLSKVKNLQSITWATPLSTAPAHTQTGAVSILECLQTWQPHAKLSFVCHSREFDGKLFPIDDALLSSPQLHTFDATLCVTQESKYSSHSEMQLLKQCLIRGGSVKVLRFEIQDLSDEYRRAPISPPLSFTWEPTDRFPALEELGLPPPQYNMNATRCAYHLTRENLLMWTQAMDWTRMRRLDFHSNAPPLFFAMFTDRVPNLKYLRWGMSPSPDCPGWGGTPTCASAFMRSVTALEEVVFNGGLREFNDFVYGILEILNAQGRNLKRLTLECGAMNGEGFTIAQYWDIFERAPGLEYLRISSCGAFLSGAWEGGDARLAPREKWKTCRRNKHALKVDRSKRNEAHVIWVPGRREPGILLGPVTRNYVNPRDYEGDHQDFFG